MKTTAQKIAAVKSPTMTVADVARANAVDAGSVPGGRRYIFADGSALTITYRGEVIL